MNTYNSRIFRKTIIDLPNMFLPIENNLPEDICFYRNSVPCFFTVSHEKMAFTNNETKEDIEFLKENNIRCYYEEI